MRPSELIDKTALGSQVFSMPRYLPVPPAMQRWVDHRVFHPGSTVEIGRTWRTGFYAVDTSRGDSEGAVLFHEYDTQAMPFWQRLQVEQKDWSLYNFGPDLPHRSLLGIIEEIGEFDQAIDDGVNRLKINDAVGDIAVFAASYCNANGLLLQSIWEQRQIPRDEKGMPWLSARAGVRRLWGIAGKMSHSHLKKEQGIRGKSRKHHRNLRIQLCRMFGLLSLLMRQQFSADYETLCRAVWDEVSKRDYRKDQQLVGVPAPGAQLR
jgi:NTP pyrophosphatase (non-canonical NTP hydrolase)